MTVAVLVNQPLPGFEPVEQKADVDEAPVESVARSGISLDQFGLLHARAVHDRWQTDPGYPLRSHLFDYLCRCGFSLAVESPTDREIYNGLFDWIESLGTDER